MKRLLTLLMTIGLIFGLMALPVSAMDKGVVKLKKGEPVHIAYWFVISGANTSLGTVTARGVEIAADKFGGEIKGHPIRSVAKTNCATLKVVRRRLQKSPLIQRLSVPLAPTAPALPNRVCRSCGMPVFLPFPPPTPLLF